MRSSRMFEIIQLLRSASKPLRAQDIAENLEVTTRTIYRDIVSLQAMRVPIEGEAGIGYVMRPGYDLPPVNFESEEAEAITVGLSMLARTGDKGLEKAALRVIDKLVEATDMSETLFSSAWGAPSPEHVDLSEVRWAIREEVKLQIGYQTNTGEISYRTIRPFALVYYHASVVVAAWCELRDDYRHFRPDRMISCGLIEERFTGTGPALRRNWAEWRGGDDLRWQSDT